MHYCERMEAKLFARKLEVERLRTFESKMSEHTIHKYALTLVSEQTLSVPKGARFLTIQLQYNVPMIWALVDLLSPDVDHWRIRMYKTGQLMHEPTMAYLGTFQQDQGTFVFHVFAEGIT